MTLTGINMVDNIIYQLWTGSNEMSDDRKAAFSTNANINGTVELLGPEDIAELEIEDHPFHPGYVYLSPVHRSDYLRSYIMNFYGGGYTDIKHYTKDNNWSYCFDLINSRPEVDIVGVPETPRGSSIAAYNTPETTRKLLGNGFFICRPHSSFTEAWYARVQSYMDVMYERLKSYGEHADTNNGGPRSQPKDYPIPYFAIQGDIFHPLLVETYDKNPSSISNALMVGYNNRVRYR